jgi:uncharacterized membrane protein YfcA
MTVLLITMTLGAFAGTVGSLLGVGGGIFLVPFLNKVVGLPFHVSAGISLITIIATSAASSAAKGRLSLVNLRLAMVLEVFTVVGAAAGLYALAGVQQRTLELLFATTLVLIAIMVLSRIDRRNVVTSGSVDVGRMGGRYYEAESGGEVAYNLRNAPLAFSLCFIAGMVSNFGIGGGVIVVPALNTWSGVPIRVAAAISSFMLGVTALVIAAHAYQRGQVVPELAAAAVLGVLVGTQLGIRLGVGVRAKTQKLILVALVLAVATVYFFFPDLKAPK